MIHSKIVLSAALAAFTISTATVKAADWPRFRGPDGNGVSMETDWNPSSLATPKIAWKVNVGKGYSSVSVVDGKVFTLGNIDSASTKNDVVVALDLNSGKTLWSFSYPCKPGDYPGPRSTPSFDNGNLYTLSREGDLFCLNSSTGKMIWKKNLVTDFKTENIKWNFAGSVVIDNDMLILNANSAGLALNKKDGSVKWNSAAGAGGYSTPVACMVNGKKCFVIFGKKAVNVVDAANGAIVSSYPWETSWDVNAADPLVVDNSIFITSGYGTGCALMDPSVNPAKEIWKNKNIRSHFSSPLYIDGYIYGIDGNAGKGELKCLDPKTGNVLWAQDVGFGGMSAANKKLILLSEKGTLTIADALPKGYTQISSGKVVDKPLCWTSPILANGRILSRNNEGDLVCVDVRK